MCFLYISVHARKRLLSFGACVIAGETDKNRKEDREKPNQETEQLSFLQFSNHPVVEMIRSLDLMNLTPSGAIAILEQMKEAVKDLDGE